MKTVSKSKTSLFAATLGLLWLLFPCVARADRFGWSFSAGGVDGNGQLTTTAFSDGQALITAISGTYDGLAINALLSPGTLAAGVGLPSGAICPANDNVLYIPGPFLDCGGLAFDAGGLEVNLYYYGPTFLYAGHHPANRKR